MLWERIVKLIRSLQKPMVTIILGAVLAVDAWSLDAWRFRIHGEYVPNGWGRPQHYSHYPNAYIMKDGKSFRLIKANFSPEPSEGVVLGEVRYYSTDLKLGYWAMTRHIHYEDFDIYTKKPFTAKQNKEVIKQYVDRVGKINKQSPEYIALARQGGGEITTILWFGYIHSFAALILGSLFLISFGWLLPIIINRRHKALIAMNLCPKCRYDMRESSEVCPECGWQRESEA